MQNLQKSLVDDTHPFSIEHLHGIDNLNDLHLNQLNTQLRYELRNLNKEVGVNVRLSDDDDDEDDEGDNDEDEDEDEDGEGEGEEEGEDNAKETYSDGFNDNGHANHSVHPGEQKTGSSNGADEDDEDLLNHDAHNIERTLVNAFNESESEPFKNYIKSIIERGHINAVTQLHHFQMDNTSNLDLDETGNVTINEEFGTNPTDDVTGGGKILLNGYNTDMMDSIRYKSDSEVLPLTKRMKLGDRSNENQKNTAALITRIANSSPRIRHSFAGSGTSEVEEIRHDRDADLAKIKKCSRCRMKRLQETEGDLQKYQTCVQCRERRKVKDRKPRVLVKLPNLSDDWKTFISKVSLNNVVDLHQHNFRAYSNETEFPRYQPEALTSPIVQNIGEKIVKTYIQPLQEVTGFKFAVRDHHNPSLCDVNRAKKITWMFICSQDKFRRRKSRSENKRQVMNRLKTEECCSKITLSYDIVHGIVQISYNHKHHKPLHACLKMNESLEKDLGGLTGEDASEDRDRLIPNTPNSSNDASDKGMESIGDITKENELEVDREVMEAAAAAVAAVAASSDVGMEYGSAETYVDDGSKSNPAGDKKDGSFVVNSKEQNIDGGAVGSRPGSKVGADLAMDHGDDLGQGKVFGDASSFENIDDMDMMHVGNEHVRVGMEDVDVDVDVDIDVSDVAEIAKLLKQVQQEQSRRLSAMKQYDLDRDPAAELDAGMGVEEDGLDLDPDTHLMAKK